MAEPAYGMGKLVCLCISRSRITLREIFVSADYLQATRISFNSREDATRFAERQGEDCACHQIWESI